MWGREDLSKVIYSIFITLVLLRACPISLLEANDFL